MQLFKPENFKEALIMSLPNCTIMVFGMMTLNLWIYGALTPTNFMYALPKIYLTAFTLDFFVIGPSVLRFVSRHNIHKLMPVFRVGLMAGILTFFAPIIESGHVPSLVQYLIALPRNYIVALCLQVGLAFPLGAYVFGRYKMRKISVAKH